MTDSNIELKGFDELSKKFNTFKGDEAEYETTLALADYMEQKASDNLEQRIYSQPPSPHYRRTGKAQRGRWIKERTEGHEVKFSTEIAGADKDYTVFLNKNRRIRKLNTNFFDDALKDTQSNRQKIIDEVTPKIIKLINK
jgi:hypothetical protein